MIGQSSPTSSEAAFAQRLAQADARIAGLERELSRPASLGTFTVTITQTNTPTKTTTYASWRRTGGIVHWAFSVTFTSAGTAGATILVSWADMPAAVTPLPHAAGTFEYFDSPGTFYIGDVRWNSATQWFFRGHLETGNIGVDPNFAIANGDVLSAAGWYFA